MAIYRGPGGPGDATADASNAAALADSFADAANASAGQAAASAASALAAKVAAELAETNAETAETNAEAAEAAAEAVLTDAGFIVVAADLQGTDTIGTVATNIANVNAVGNNNANVTTVAGSIASVNTNATNIANINQNAANIVAIQNASTNATTATTQAGIATTQAAAASASAAAASAVALGNEPVRHSVRPSLLLDFANTKTLDPRITFTRASTGTFYDGKTVAKAEENLILQSQFASVWAFNDSALTLNNVTAPDGTSTGSTLTASVATNNSGAFQGTGITAAGVTYSVFAKAGTCNFVGISPTSTGTACYANFNLSTGAVASSAGCTASIVSVGNGWYRCVMANTTLTGNGFVVIAPKNTDPAGNPWTTGTPTVGDSVLLWGAQLEIRSSVTAYTATTTAPITNYIPALQTAAAGVARFEHNPVTGESLGLEIEEQRTNLFLRSEEIDNAYWTKVTSSITANAVVAPDGTLTADKVVPNSGVSGALTRAITPSVSTSYTFSIYAKAGEHSLIGLSAGGSSLTGAGGSGADRENRFNLALGTIEVSNSSPTITPVGNGWYRLTIRLTTDSDGGSLIAIISAVSTGNGFSGIYIWGAQLEAGSFATSYIPTVASQVTRSADSASMTGTNFSSWYRADEGTMYAESASLGGNVNPFVASDNSGNNTISLAVRPSGVSGSGAFVTTLGVSQAVLTSFTFSQINKVSFSYKVNDFAASVNSATAITDTSGNIPVVTRAYIGAGADGTTLSQNIKKLAYYPKRLTNAELQGLTTV